MSPRLIHFTGGCRFTEPAEFRSSGLNSRSQISFSHASPVILSIIAPTIA
jgi:hypothetical protein